MDGPLIAAMSMVGAGTAGMLLWTARSHWATYRTSQDKHKMLDLCKQRTLVYRYWNDLNTSFLEHHSEYMMFRNPWRLYSSSFIDLGYRNGVISREAYIDAYPAAVMREEKAKKQRIEKFADNLLAEVQTAVPTSDTQSHNPHVTKQ